MANGSGSAGRVIIAVVALGAGASVSALVGAFAASWYEGWMAARAQKAQQ